MNVIGLIVFKVLCYKLIRTSVTHSKQMILKLVHHNLPVKSSGLLEPGGKKKKKKEKKKKVDLLP